MSLHEAGAGESQAAPVKITQLYEHVELYASGEPPQNTLFLLGQETPSLLDSAIHFSISLDGQPGQRVDELLLIDPPADAAERFKLEGNVAALYTAGSAAGRANSGASSGAMHGLAALDTRPGGIAHVRIGQHYLDIHSFGFGNLVHIPPLGLFISGIFGSDVALPLLADGSNGEEELGGLRQAAALLKAGQFQLMIPSIGAMEADPVSAMGRLANDVAYLHGIRRVVQSLRERGGDFEELLAISDSLLPAKRSGAEAEENHLLNLQTLFAA